MLSFFTFLCLFTLGLAAFNVISSGSLTGRVVAGHDYTEELFIGNNYEFKYYPSAFKDEDSALQVRGQLVETAGIDHELQITAYAFTTNGEISGTSSSEVFLGSDQTIALNLRIPFEQDISRALLYIEDSRTSVRIEKAIEKQGSSLTGRVTAEIDENGKTYGSFLVGFFIFASLVLFVVYRISEHKKSINLNRALNHKQTRHFIDLDIR